jgi:hypothetical protein
MMVLTFYEAMSVNMERKGGESGRDIPAKERVASDTEGGGMDIQ